MTIVKETKYATRGGVEIYTNREIFEISEEIDPYEFCLKEELYANKVEAVKYAGSAYIATVKVYPEE